MKQGARDIPLSAVRENPAVFKGRLFILGGIIVSTKLTEQGAMIEALAVPVDSYGYLTYDARYDGRFLALYPRSEGLIDPMIFSKGREITLAGEFVEVRKGKIDEMEYAYPLFHVRQLHLWPEITTYYYGYPYSYYPYWYYDPWWRPYPYGYPYYYWPPPHPR
jgi:outer membrane lipoprotein